MNELLDKPAKLDLVTAILLQFENLSEIRPLPNAHKPASAAAEEPTLCDPEMLNQLYDDASEKAAILQEFMAQA
ncbi:MAG: hypothetical protein KBG15_21550 [Kofleriaceae bacterium]|nr:hypothetical protein [Kofleriaceae bacterium]